MHRRWQFFTKLNEKIRSSINRQLLLHKSVVLWCNLKSESRHVVDVRGWLLLVPPSIINEWKSKGLMKGDTGHHFYCFNTCSCLPYVYETSKSNKPNAIRPRAKIAFNLFANVTRMEGLPWYRNHAQHIRQEGQPSTWLNPFIKWPSSLQSYLKIFTSACCGRHARPRGYVNLFRAGFDHRVHLGKTEGFGWLIPWNWKAFLSEIGMTTKISVHLPTSVYVYSWYYWFRTTGSNCTNA